MQYHVMFEYTIPQFTDIDLDVEEEKSDEDIRGLAKALFDDTYPEAMDVEIIEVVGPL